VSAIASKVRSHWVEVAWGAFAAVNVAVIVLLERWETIPFHFVWVSLTLVYGFRVWRVRTTMAVLLVVMAVTGGALIWTVTRGHESLDEVAEVPLMAAMFVAMVWHARRRLAATEEARRLAENEHRLLERQREFVRDASHELRTPITVARGHAELIRAESQGTQAGEDVGVVLDELERLERLSERLLILAAAEHSSFLEVVPVEVEPFVLGTARRWEPAATREWLVDVVADGSILADRDRLGIALDALIENAVKATDEGQRIRIAAWPVDGSLVLEVADAGMGIDRDQLPRVFDRFSRLDPGRARGKGGTGLGLAIVRAIAEAHGGSVSAESESGLGSTFRIHLPGFRSVGARPQATRERGVPVSTLGP